MRDVCVRRRGGSAPVLGNGEFKSSKACIDSLSLCAYLCGMTLAEKIGMSAPSSVLLKKAARLGLSDPAALEGLAVARGCWHYRQPEMPDPPSVDESQFSNEELAIMLLSPIQPYSPHTIRLGAAMLGAAGNRVERLFNLSKAEGCEMVVRYIAKAGLQFEPGNPLWHDLLDKLPETREPEDGVLPHPTRFVSMTGFTRAGPGKVTVWIRPRADLALVHG